MASQARKLGLRDGLRIAIDGQSAGWSLQDPPGGLEYVEDGPADVVVAFFTTAGDLAPRLAALADRVYPSGAVWVAWPRRAGGHRSDITDNVVRECALPLGLVDVKVAAIDDDWSGLRLVWRLSERQRRG
jgi:Protein of unknown function (DUF3052)